MLREILLQVFEHDGHHPQVAGSAAEALGLYTSAFASAQPFDVVITDFSMPGMDGIAFARQIRALNPDEKIILMSGWGPRLEESPGHLDHVNLVLHKPASIADLRRAISQLFNGSTP